VDGRPVVSEFQPFLRFYTLEIMNESSTIPVMFQPFLRFYGMRRIRRGINTLGRVSTLLEILVIKMILQRKTHGVEKNKSNNTE
jgi:hypothetical protein